MKRLASLSLSVFGHRERTDTFPMIVYAFLIVFSVPFPQIWF
jgi:hypothetical protein